MEPVDVLAEIDGAENLPLLDVARQRRLDEDAVDLGVAIEPFDQRRAVPPADVFSSSTIVSERMPSSSAFAPFMRT